MTPLELLWFNRALQYTIDDGMTSVNGGVLIEPRYDGIVLDDGVSVPTGENF